ncbi:hypothetical protein LR48_Vigan04g127700 [Vigna angularis]|uniref:Uncharacterized protein n=1 Tax=Phaseolus angularis TaxID=3914 RepID=A0A0L9UEW2_PHAAN|nr:hypothetical protein LR48_Vigan04g127700 [Vigna angularis]
MASSSSSRRKWKVARIARNVNPTGWISDEDIRQKLFTLRKIKTVVSPRYLKLVSVFYSNLKMSDETFCNKVNEVDMKLIKEILIHFESSESYNRTSLINKATLHKMGMQHTPEGLRFKDKVTKDGDEAGQSSSIPYMAHSEFERTLLREIKSLKIMCQETRNDVLEIKEHLKLNNTDEDQSCEEGSTPNDSHEMEENENVAEESDNDMLLGTFLNKNKKKI